MAITMQPVLTSEPPLGEHWRYEAKYDGYRALLSVSKTGVSLISRNSQPLDKLFPEIVMDAKTKLTTLEDLLPFTVDGEIVSLTNRFRSSFEYVQKRGMMKRNDLIGKAAETKPCQYLAFDLLTYKGEAVASLPYTERKQKLFDLLKRLGLPMAPEPRSTERIQYIPETQDFHSLWDAVKRFDGEGIVAKKKDSRWLENKKTAEWLKLKNYKKAAVFMTGYNKANGYMTLSVSDRGQIREMGSVSHGLGEQERNAILAIVKEHGRETKAGEYAIDPSICLTVHYLTIHFGTLREVSFVSFEFDMSWEECTYTRLLLHSRHVHPSLQLTSLDKVIFPESEKSKADYISYLAEIGDFLLPFLENRALTVIRYPHGAGGESFFQKNKPDYAPEFVTSIKDDEHEHIVCHDYSVLFWLANQLALEFHIPFQTADTEDPTEIVFDLDPPSQSEFPLAVRAAEELRRLFDQLGLISFPKLSGNKGIQIYIPISKNAFTYEDTRTFTSFAATYCVSLFPDLFTTERLIKNRSGKLYIDYVQHAPGKTIICPYSARGNGIGTVAAPLFWEEVGQNLSPADFTMEAVIKRTKELGCPFEGFFRQPQDQQIKAILNHLKDTQRAGS
ncbi:DNA ligase D [Bacillus sonorensis]|uniref:DNA ligase D n=1 Tax=Bacillus sonorensis TaxID=119858 RepID=UPI001F00ABC6|nr:DNA ligase D [Bacillus sonorensis]MCF7619180.1 DNA ligase D [Bacillus sonorensis]MCY7855544.1 DNA ligase D [Bacillus sonorensis]MCY8032419.1 DNA ligase D [Bacillus sonorensis]MCY8565116.1 DNA ligase D [Bacillus sonorensis]MEC1441056.1 DNA ligase D [Bacillus sonorensis]